MAKRFLTARDIDEHANNGIFELHITDDVVVTDFGRERARDRKVKLTRLAPGQKPDPHPECSQELDAGLLERVRVSVIARLGSTPENLDAIIKKVLSNQR